VRRILFPPEGRIGKEGGGGFCRKKTGISKEEKEKRSSGNLIADAGNRKREGGGRKENGRATQAGSAEADRTLTAKRRKEREGKQRSRKGGIFLLAFCCSQGGEEGKGDY